MGELRKLRSACFVGLPWQFRRLRHSDVVLLPPILNGSNDQATLAPRDASICVALEREEMRRRRSNSGCPRTGDDRRLMMRAAVTVRGQRRTILRPLTTMESLSPYDFGKALIYMHIGVGRSAKSAKKRQKTTSSGDGTCWRSPEVIGVGAGAKGALQRTLGNWPKHGRAKTVITAIAGLPFH